MRLRLSILGLVTLLALNWVSAQVSVSAKKSAPARESIFIEPSSAALPGGKANLTISELTRRADTYVGDYQFKVSPYFFKSEKGTLAINVADEALEKLARGFTVDFSGLATTSGSGKTRGVSGKAKPSDRNRGSVALRFMAGDRELLFNTAYRFGDTPAESH